MPGALGAAAIVGVAAALTVGLATGGSAAVFGQRLAGAADAAALAGADAASGAVIAVPCEVADLLAASSGAALASCEVVGLEVTVTVSASFGPLAATASARAGPPG
ncbi:helicase [Microbacterium pumilum]|uniref:Helicase n=1 Tax=Microbacterium pumilum TaxID=344165 RepID=A0ABN2T109_9MICO